MSARAGSAPLTVIVVDSGTSTTRARLVRDGEVVAGERADVGVRDSAAVGSPAPLVTALRPMLRELSSGGGVSAVVMSGMITSNLGLLEVPHLPAPAGFAELAAGMVRREMPELTSLPCYFVPGIRTFGRDGLLEEMDVLRGEEVEVLGLMRQLGMAGPATFVHFGSHHKVIEVGEGGRVRGSRTSMTGELFATIATGTVLKDSVVPLDELVLDEDAWREGMEAARRLGPGRALFLVRVGQQVGGRSKQAMTSYLAGVLASFDLELVDSIRPGPVVLYGRPTFRDIMATVLREEAEGGLGGSVVDDAVADDAAAIGAYSLARAVLTAKPRRTPA